MVANVQPYEKRSGLVAAVQMQARVIQQSIQAMKCEKLTGETISTAFFILLRPLLFHPLSQFN